MVQRTLSHDEARRFYDRFGARQDSQHFYEGPAVEDLCTHARFGEAHSVVELGCGTGRFAAELLERRLPPEARYLGLDVSETMVALARERTARFGERAEIRRTDGAPTIPGADGSFDRVVSTYVLDLLAEADIRAALAEARRVLCADGGLLCLAGLGPGATSVSRLVAALWSRVHRLRPQLVGGCRPLEVLSFLSEAEWEVRHHRLLAPYGIPSEVVVAAPRRG